MVAALRRRQPIVPVFIYDPAGEGAWAPGGASRWWLHHSLTALAAALVERGSCLIVLKGDSEEVLGRLITETKADALYWNRRYEPAVQVRDERLAKRLGKGGMEVRSFNSALLFEPDEIKNKQGNPFQVFSAYWRHASSLPIPEPEALPRASWSPPERWPKGLALEALELLPKISWDKGFYTAWTPGEQGAQARLKAFLREAIQSYDHDRDFLAVDGVSRLSPHLHWGEIGPRQVWAAVRALSEESGIFPAHRGAAKFLAELGWREFAHHLLKHFPHTPESPLRAEFSRFQWEADPKGTKARAWKRGRTGYPVVDAAMRQLWTTGWMHNRARMVVASFLVKHLRLSWTQGAAWFWDTLVDADLANNTLGWQWSAGCGADAAPYFRVFAPVLQGEKFDPKGDYVRRWVPELSSLPIRYLHQPWEAPEDVLKKAGVVLGKTYPRPIVDHAKARVEALEAFQILRKHARSVT